MASASLRTVPTSARSVVINNTVDAVTGRSSTTRQGQTSDWLWTALSDQSFPIRVSRLMTALLSELIGPEGLTRPFQRESGQPGATCWRVGCLPGHGRGCLRAS